MLKKPLYWPEHLLENTDLHSSGSCPKVVPFHVVSRWASKLLVVDQSFPIGLVPECLTLNLMQT